MSQAPRLGIQVEPAVTPQPSFGTPQSSGAQRADELLGVLRGVGSVAGQLGGFARRREAEQQDEQNEALFRGQASLDARSSTPELADRISQGGLDFLFDDLPEDESVENAVQQAVQQQLPEDAPESYADQYRREMVPWLTQQVVDRQRQVKDENRQGVMTIASQGMSVAESVEDVQGLIDKLDRDWPGMDEADIVNETVAPALQSTASTGQSEQFEMLAGFLEQRFPAFVAEQRESLKSNQSRIQARRARQRQRDTDQFVASLLEPEVGDDGELKSPNFEHARESVRRHLLPDLPANERLSVMDRIEQQQQEWNQRRQDERRRTFERQMAGSRLDALERQRHRQESGDPMTPGEIADLADERIEQALTWRDAGLAPGLIEREIGADVDMVQQMQRRQERQQQQTEAMESFGTALINPEETGGVDSVREVLEREGVDDQIISNAMEQTWRSARDRIDERLPFDPAAVSEAIRVPEDGRSAEQSRQIEAFRNNLRMRLDIMSQSEDLEDPGISRLMRGITARVRPDMTDEQLQQQMPQLGFAFDLFREMQTHPAVRQRHVSGDDLEFMRMATWAHEQLTDVSPAGAMVLARQGIEQGMTVDSVRNETVNESKMNEAADNATDPGFWSGAAEWLPGVSREVKNDPYIRENLRTRARLLTIPRGGGEPTSADLERAAADFREDHVLLNGWAVPHGGSRLVDQIGRPGFDATARMISRAHVERLEGETNPEDFTLIRVGDFWRPSYRDTHLPAEGGRAYTDRDLRRIHGMVAGMEDAAQQRRDAERHRLRHGDRQQRRAVVQRRKREQLQQQIENDPANADVYHELLEGLPEPGPAPEPVTPIDELYPDVPEHLTDIAEVIQAEAPTPTASASDVRGAWLGRRADDLGALYDVTIGNFLENERQRRARMERLRAQDRADLDPEAANEARLQRSREQVETLDLSNTDFEAAQRRRQERAREELTP